MASIETEVYNKHFWVETAKALLILAEKEYAGNTAINEIVTGLLTKFPQGLPLLEERNTPVHQPYKPRKKQKPITEGTIHSTNKATAKFPKQTPTT
jgi:hypothetical protein